MKLLREMNAEEKKRTAENCEKIDKMFKPFYGGGSSSWLVARMLTLGLITYTVEEVALQQPKDLTTIPTGTGSESDAHLTLKYNACLLLKNLGEDKPTVEQEGYDVYSPKLKVRIECGHTDQDRLPWSFKENDVAEFWVLQYPEEGDSAPLYKFKPSKDCKRELQAYFSEISRQAMMSGE
jgi:hypothetical protein